MEPLAHSRFSTEIWRRGESESVTEEGIGEGGKNGRGRKEGREEGRRGEW